MIQMWEEQRFGRKWHHLDLHAGCASTVACAGVQAHSESARAVRFSPDGSLLVSASADKSLLAVDTATGQPTARKANAHAAGIGRLLFVSDTVLASGEAARTPDVAVEHRSASTLIAR
jgi:WD40 repeat protein